MTPEQRIDAALDAVLVASGSALKNYTMPKTLAAMRAAMRDALSDGYIKGSNDCFAAMGITGHGETLAELERLRRQAADLEKRHHLRYRMWHDECIKRRELQGQISACEKERAALLATIDTTYSEHVGRDHMHLPLNEAVGKVRAELEAAKEES